MIGASGQARAGRAFSGGQITALVDENVDPPKELLDDAAGHLAVVAHTQR